MSLPDGVEIVQDDPVTYEAKDLQLVSRTTADATEYRVGGESFPEPMVLLSVRSLTMSQINSLAHTAGDGDNLMELALSLGSTQTLLLTTEDASTLFTQLAVALKVAGEVTRSRTEASDPLDG